MFESLSTLDSIRLNINQDGVHVLNAALAIIMFGVALSIKTDDFKQLLSRPKPVVTGYAAQFLLLPFLTFLLIILLNLPPSVALGMILVAACPGGNISNFLTSLAKGNAALSVTLTALATLSAIFMTPFNFTLWGGWYVNYYNNHGNDLLRPLEIDPSQMFLTVFIILGLPVVLGILTAKFLPNLANRIIRPLRWFSIIFFLVIVVVMLWQNIAQFFQSIHLIFLLVLLHNALALGSGFSLASVMKLKLRDKKAITIETGIQNSGLALALMFNPKIFPQDQAMGGMMVIVAWWGIWHIISGLSLSSIWSTINGKDETEL